MASRSVASKVEVYYDVRTGEVRAPRRIEVRLNQEWVNEESAFDGKAVGMPAFGWTPNLLKRCGLLEIVETEQPPDDRNTKHDRIVELIDEVPTVVWVARHKTAKEVREETVDELTDLETIEAQLAEIKVFLDDADIQASLDRANNVAPTTQELNRTLKALIRQARRAANLDNRSLRYVFGQVHSELLDEDV